MVTVKREPPVDNVIPADTPQNVFDHFGATPPPGPLAHPIVQPQVPWWTPQTKPAPGPQEDYEYEFQASPPPWPMSPSVVIKSPNRTVPTTLDGYEMQLKLLEQQNKVREAMGKQPESSAGAASIFQTDLTEAAQADHRFQLKLLELHNKCRLRKQRLWLEATTSTDEGARSAPGFTTSCVLEHVEELKRLEAQEMERIAKGKQVESSTGAAWIPPEGWRESNQQEYELQLRILDEQHKCRLETYELQIRMRDQQYKSGLEMETNPSAPQSAWSQCTTGTNQQNSAGPVSGSTWTPPPGWEESLAPEYKEALKYLRETVANTHRMSAERVRAAASSNTLDPSAQPANIPRSSHLTHADYQMQLMLLEQQNKKRLTMARQEQVALFSDKEILNSVANNLHLKQLQQQQIIQHQRQQQAARQAWMAQQYRGMAMGVPNGMGQMTQAQLDAISIYGRQSTLETTPTGREQSVDSDWSTQFTPESTPGLPESAGVHIKYEFEPSPTSLAQPNWGGGEGFCNCTAATRAYQIQGFHTQKEQLMAQQAQAAAAMRTLHAQPGGRNHALQDYQMQLILLEQQNKRRSRMKNQTQDPGSASMSPPTNGNHAVQDYEMQLMLLEQQNKKRLMMAREEQEAQASRNVKPKTTQVLDDEQTDDASSEDFDFDSFLGGSRSEILHHKPLVIRERPTCDD